MAKAYLTPDGWRKTCYACKQEFNLDFFFKNSQTSDGLASACKTCSKQKTKAVEAKRKAAGLGRLNPETEARRKERRKAAYDANPEKHRERAKANRIKHAGKPYMDTSTLKARRPEYYRAYARSYYHLNKDSIGPRNRELVMRRYMLKEQATPSWADRESVMAFYREAARLTLSTGVEHQVDHIVPLVSKLVCGLHTHTNMQILIKSDNVKKGNRKWPGHPNPELDLP